MCPLPLEKALGGLKARNRYGRITLGDNKAQEIVAPSAVRRDQRLAHPEGEQREPRRVGWVVSRREAPARGDTKIANGRRRAEKAWPIWKSRLPLEHSDLRSSHVPSPFGEGPGRPEGTK